MSYSPRRTMTLLANPDARAAIQLQPKCCCGCGKPLGEMDAANTQLFIGEAEFLGPVVFTCRKATGGCGAVNRWGPTARRECTSKAESLVL